MSDPTQDAPADRARIEPATTQKRLDALPVLYLVGFLILASALIYIWRHPSLPRSVVQDSARIDMLRSEVDARKQENDALQARLAALEARPVADTAALDRRITEVERRPAPPNQALLEQRITALEGRQGPDLKPLENRLAALEARPQPNLQPLEQRIGSVESSLKSELAATAKRLDDEVQKNAAAIAAIRDRAGRAARLQAAVAAMDAGQPLGTIPGAPQALARFATQAPPTEAELRLSFDQAATAAQRASQPAITDNQSFMDRMWTRAQQSVTVRQGDRVLVGDPIAGVIAQARQQLDAGDLPGALKALDGLAGPARAAMEGWIGRAKSLLDARAAIAEMARG